MQDRNQLKAESEDHTGNPEDPPAPRRFTDPLGGVVPVEVLLGLRHASGERPTPWR